MTISSSIKVGDIVSLNKPYKVEDFRHNQTFLAALNDGATPQGYSQKERIYTSWSGFNYGIVNDILSRKIDGTPRNLSLFLYYHQPNGVWLLYSLGKSKVPTFVDFHISEVTFVHKSSSPTY